MEKEKEYLEQGYCAKLSPYPEKNSALYLRPNKIYDIGNAPTSSIIIGNIMLCHLICSKEGSIILKQTEEAKGLLKINDKQITSEKVLLKHKDIIQFEKVKFQYEMFFSDGIVRINCVKLHQYLLSKYTEFEKELHELDDKVNKKNISIMIYRKGLKELFDKLDKMNKDRIERFRDVLRDVIDIILDENPTNKFEMKNNALQKEIQMKTMSKVCDQTVDVNEMFSNPSTASISSIRTKNSSVSTQKQQPIINNQKEKSLMFSNTLSCALNFENEDEEESYEQFRKRTFDQSSSSSDYQSKRSLNQ